MFCRKCGTDIPADSVFCPSCGVSTAATDPGATPAATPSFAGTVGLSGERTVIGGGIRGPQLQPNELFHERYRVDSLVGEGGMGQVYKAEDELLGETVCLKVVRPEFVQSQTFARRFLREGGITRRLRHPNIISVYDVAVSEGLYYLTMEFLAGRSLREWMLELRRQGGDCELAVAVRICSEILKGLEAAHLSAVIHRDLKPENVMLLADPSPAAAPLKILDFGIARALDSGVQLTMANQPLGTPAYMAPEQESGAESVGPEADIYSVAAVFYELLLGLPPRARWDLPTEIRSDLSKDVDDLLLAGLRQHPRKRIASAGEFQDRLESLVRESGEAAALPSVPAEPPRVAAEPLPPAEPPLPPIDLGTLPFPPKRRSAAPPWPEPGRSAPLGGGPWKRPASLEELLRRTSNPVLRESFQTMKLVAPEGERPFLIDEEAILIPNFVPQAGPYPVPQGGVVMPISSWLEESGPPWDRAGARALLAAYGRRLPRAGQLRQAREAGVWVGLELPLWIRDDGDRLDLGEERVAPEGCTPSRGLLGVIELAHPGAAARPRPKRSWWSA